MENNKLFSEYLKELEITGHSEQALTGLRNRVPKLLVFLQETALSVEEMDASSAQDFQAWLVSTGRKDGKSFQSTTIRAYLGAAANFYDYLKRKGLITTNPFREIRKIRSEKKLPCNLLKEKQMSLFLEELSRFDQEKALKRRVTCYKMHVIAELMYSTGLRVSEVAALKPEDIDLDRGVVTVQQGKGGASRIAYLNEYALQVVRLYLKRMRPLVFTEWNERNGELLFGVRWSFFSKIVNKNLQETAASLGLGSFTSHGFRHAVGYHLLRAGCPIRYIQQILGHKHIKNTEIYTKVDREDLREVLDTYHPRKWKS